MSTDVALQAIPEPEVYPPRLTVSSQLWNFLVRSRAWISLLIILPFAIGAILSQPLAREGTWGDLDLDFCGWLLFMAGAGLRWWATLYIGGIKQVNVVNEGPYSMCRNPLYLGTFLMVMGLCFFLESLTFAFGCVVASVFYMSVTVLAEERVLREVFGQPYIEYCQSVPRIWPRFRLLRGSPTIFVSQLGLKAEALRTARWLWVPMLGEWLAHLRAEQWWPRLLHLP